jgi:hypothetical protein
MSDTTVALETLLRPLDLWQTAVGHMTWESRAEDAEFPTAS